MTLTYGPPNPSLLRELRQVGRDASAVVQALREANDLQDSFPRAVLEDLCWSLAGLKDGTAENCRPTLEYARGRIPQIRREHFFLEEEDLDEIAPLPEEPRQDRGNRLDGKMKDLLASITTALDEYRAQAQDRFDDEVRGEEVVVLSHPEETTDPVARAADVIAATDKGRAELHDSGVDQSENGEVLSRRLKDTNNLAWAARSLLQSGVIVRRWFEGIANAMQLMPELIEKAGNAIQVGADDIANPLAGWWSRFQDAALKSSIEVVRDFGVTLEEISTKLKQRRGGPAVQPRQDEQLRDPAAQPKQDGQSRDPSILRAEAEVERMLKAGIEVPIDLAQAVKRIDVSGTGNRPTRIPRWQDIASFSSLEELHVLFTDFALSRHGGFLAGKVRLSVLKLPETDSSDLSPLGHLTTLTELTLNANRITDLTPLGDLSALTSLTLGAYRATDLTPLGRLTALSSLALHVHHANDLTPLGRLIDLTSLTLGAYRATDLTPLGRLTALTSLTLNLTFANDLTALEGLAALTSLTLRVESSIELAPLGRLTTLTSLTLDAINATDLTPLGRLTALTSLTLNLTLATDLTPLERLPALTSLTLQVKRATDLTPLERLPALTSLTLQVHHATDMTALGQLTALTSLTLHADNATDLTPLGQLTALTSLTLNGVRGADLTHLGTLTRLETLSIMAPWSIDLLWLPSIKTLKTVRIRAPHIHNRDALSGVEVIVEKRGLFSGT